MKQLVMKHTACRSVLSAISELIPLASAMEKYDPIGRLRDKDLGGLPVDAKAVIKDGTSLMISMAS